MHKERIAGFCFPARGSLGVSFELTRILQRRAKGLIGSAAEGNSASFLVIVSWKDQSLQSCDIHESSQCFWDVTLYPGWVRVCGLSFGCN